MSNENILLEIHCFFLHGDVKYFYIADCSCNRGGYQNRGGNKMKKIKKILCTFLVIVMCLTAAPLQGFVGLEWPNLSELFATKANATEEYTSGYYTYTISEGEATITDCDTSISGDIVIPDTLGGYPVTIIGFQTFLHVPV